MGNNAKGLVGGGSPPLESEEGGGASFADLDQETSKEIVVDNLLSSELNRVTPYWKDKLLVVELPGEIKRATHVHHSLLCVPMLTENNHHKDGTVCGG